MLKIRLKLTTVLKLERLSCGGVFVVIGVVFITYPAAQAQEQSERKEEFN